MTRPVLFLDIDGVLLSGRAWLLPANCGLREKVTDPFEYGATKLIGHEVSFDPCAVELVTQICAATGACIVVASYWRYTVGLEQTRSKLLEQGLSAKLLHDDWACPMIRHGSPDKRWEIMHWLGEHGVTQYGTWLVIDDDDVVPGATLCTDALDGIGVRDAAAAVRFFNDVDPVLGVAPLPAGDVERILRAFDGDWIGACRWLEGANIGQPGRFRPSSLLSVGKHAEALRCLEAASAARAAREQQARRVLDLRFDQCTPGEDAAR
jgi:hypothetical protein